MGMNILVKSAATAIYSNIPSGYPSPVSLAKNIRRLRRMADLTQIGLSQRLGVGQGAISKWETGESEPSVSALPRLAVALGTSLDRLLEGIEAQYDSSRDLSDHRSVVQRTPHHQGESDVPASDRIQERDTHIAFVRKVQDAAGELTRIATTLGAEARQTQRALTGRGRRDRKAG
jgi:transcriptional regulator with XRE-family HTH domain